MMQQNEITHMTPATSDQSQKALAMQDVPVRPQPVPTQLTTFDNPPRLISPTEIDQELTQQIKTYADPNMFERLINNLGPDNIGINFINRLSVVAGGTLMFQEQRTSTGQPGALHSEIIGIIPLIRQTRRMFSTPFGTGANNIPDCTSINVTPNKLEDVGFGNPGGMCYTCPHNSFVQNIGRNCSERNAIFVITKHSPIPYYLDMTVFSTRAIADMRKSLFLGSHAEYWQVVLRISLANTSTSAGRNVAIFKAEPIGVIDSQDTEVITGINNLRNLCHMVLVDFAKLVVSNKTVRFNELTDPNVIDSVINNSGQNLPVPPTMQSQMPPSQVDYNRLGGMPVPIQAQPQTPQMPQPAATDVPPWTSQTPQMPQPQAPQAPQVPQMPQPQAPQVPQMPPQMPTPMNNVQIDPETGEFLYQINHQDEPPNTQQNGEF